MSLSTKKQNVIIIDYGAGNIQSIQFALQRLGFEGILSNDRDQILKADKVIFPGVGQAQNAMSQLIKSGLHEIIPTLTMPVLGICLGQQLLCQFSEEGDTGCLGIFNSSVKKFEPKLKVPHIGWNSISQQNSLLFNGISEEENFYFVHSYYAEIGEETSAICDYIVPFSASMQKDNFYATQFHPEKSSQVGQQLLLNFLKLQIDKKI